MSEKTEGVSLETTYELFLKQLIDASNPKEMAPKTELDIYPPEGWRYGFPKRLPEDWCELEPLEKEKWFLDNGYPLEYIDRELHLWSTIWETPSTI